MQELLAVPDVVGEEELGEVVRRGVVGPAAVDLRQLVDERPRGSESVAIMNVVIVIPSRRQASASSSVRLTIFRSRPNGFL